jgi:heat shock protein HtpX
MILGPLAAGIVQMTISRTREYEADRVGAEISGQPLSLASALQKISGAARKIPNMVAERDPPTAHLFIVNPLSGTRMDNLFSTHPKVENRVARLVAMSQTMGGTASTVPSEPGPSGPWSPQQPNTSRGPWD